MRIGSTGSRRTFALLILPLIILLSKFFRNTAFMGSSSGLFQISAATLAGAGAAQVITQHFCWAFRQFQGRHFGKFGAIFKVKIVLFVHID